ncbi:hypothetical protein CRI94_17385 [Longibacter salinarum]|uniref:6-bladed beta-propeller n=1 Tax=Longibacter salinarum TaxID=1850348 RepID=A0A2A8CT22_9BACT|nr:hypothetical protein [Longibacter salinarum]PEN10361.1 hypothetical protein CRI94_17385 [Longibacter salinarum]
MRPLIVLLIVAAFVVGCTPSGCRREQDPALMPADSTSRALAQEAPVDSLALAWSAGGTDDEPMAFPRTVRFLPEGDLVVSDAERNVVYRYTREGEHVATLTPEGLDVPYLAGVRGDTLVIFNAGADRFDLILNGQRIDDASTPLQRPSDQSLAYAVATDTALYAKVVGADIASTLGRVAPSGQMSPAMELPGPFWRHAGFLRVWDDRLVSLTGYRPVVDLLPLPGLDARPDTLALTGFDSPMLERSYRFLRGDVDNAPVLTASAAPAGDRLYVLNLRPTNMRVDIFDREGQLQRVLSGAGVDPGTSFYPRDLDVRTSGDTVDIAVALTLPSPQLRLYRWIREDSLRATTDTTTLAR